MRLFIQRLTEELFRVMTAGTVVFLLMEIVKPRSVLAFMNFNIWLSIWLLNGMLIIALKVNKK